jgi:hypothetical protein
MACLICRDLERTLDFRHSKWISCGLVPTIVLTSSTHQP